MFLDLNRLPQVLASRCKILCEVSFSTCLQTYNFAIFTLPWTGYTLNCVYFLMVYRLYTKTLSFFLNLRVNETHLCNRPDRVVYTRSSSTVVMRRHVFSARPMTSRQLYRKPDRSIRSNPTFVESIFMSRIE